jgi:DNA (cytosine-5)-methyltransferase 1
VKAQPRLLDLFARAQGTSVGYARAGFQVTANDWDLYPKHPEVHEFIQGDAFAILDDVAFCRKFDVIAASPNCEGYSDLSHLPTTAHRDQEIHLVREKLERIGRPFVIENVDSKLSRAVMDRPLRLCGSMFGLESVCRDGQTRQLRRHRLFEPGGGAREFFYGPFSCRHAKLTGGVYGTGGGGPQTRGYRFWPEEAKRAMEIDWMHRDDICKAIPPKYTSLIGRWLMEAM